MKSAIIRACQALSHFVAQDGAPCIARLTCRVRVKDSAVVTRGVQQGHSDILFRIQVAHRQIRPDQHSRLVCKQHPSHWTAIHTDRHKIAGAMRHPVLVNCCLLRQPPKPVEIFLYFFSSLLFSGFFPLSYFFNVSVSVGLDFWVPRSIRVPTHSVYSEREREREKECVCECVRVYSFISLLAF